MIIPTLLAAAWLGWLGPPPTKGEAVERHKVSGWTYMVLTDRFTGVQRCVVRRGDVVLNGGLVQFGFKAGTPLSDVWYRIDDQEARPWKSLAASLIAAGYSPNRAASWREAQRREVVFTAAQLDKASLVRIRPQLSASARSFKIAGLWRAVEAAKARGCDPTIRR